MAGRERQPGRGGGNWEGAHSLTSLYTPSSAAMSISRPSVVDPLVLTKLAARQRGSWKLSVTRAYRGVSGRNRETGEGMDNDECGLSKAWRGVRPKSEPVRAWKLTRAEQRMANWVSSSSHSALSLAS